MRIANCRAITKGFIAGHPDRLRGAPCGIGAIAFTTDTHNTGGEATTWYDDITVSTVG